MLKMLMDPMGGIVMTNDGNAILREIEVTHPAAKNMIEIARTQDEEVGDGTTSVIILAGEVMMCAKPFIERNIHPSIICSAFYKAMSDALTIIKEVAIPLDTSSMEEMQKAMWSCIGTKFASRWGNLVVDMAVQAVRVVMRGDPNIGKLAADLKRYARVEKVPGGSLEETRVLNGVMVNKDVTHPSGMRRKIKNPRILLIDMPLEYKKGESKTDIELKKASDKESILQEEVNEIASMCAAILKHKPDVVITEKGVADLTQHFLMSKGNVSIIRRVRKTDNNRIARVSGATIVHRPEDITEEDIGKECGLFEIKKIGDDYFTYFTECKNPKACTILLRGGSKDVLNEMERNFHDAIGVARNLYKNPQLIPGGGAIEMEVSNRLIKKAKEVDGIEQLPYKALAHAFEIIPRTLIANCGQDVIRTITKMR